MATEKPLVVLFGYDSSPFTQKIRLALRIRQIRYTFVLVPSMMPRSILVDNFNLTYRKIPVLAINKDLYIDTSLIFEIIYTHPAFPPSKAHPPLHTNARNRVLTRLLSSHYTDRPLFRLTTGVIPQAVWETNFGVDRSNLIGHPLDAQKLGAKVSSNMAKLDTYLSIIEPLFDAEHGWILGTEAPSGADISFYYQLDWGEKISRGEGISDLTGGGTHDRAGNGIRPVFNMQRYPKLCSWFDRMTLFIDNLPHVETKVEKTDTKRIEALMERLNATNVDKEVALMRTAASNLPNLDVETGLTIGSRVSISPDDTGRGAPTMGVLVGISTEEVVIVPDAIGLKKARVEGVRAHFPKVGFVVKRIQVASPETKGQRNMTKERSKL